MTILIVVNRTDLGPSHNFSTNNDNILIVTRYSRSLVSPHIIRPCVFQVLVLSCIGTELYVTPLSVLCTLFGWFVFKYCVCSEQPVFA